MTVSKFVNPVKEAGKKGARWPLSCKRKKVGYNQKKKEGEPIRSSFC